MDTVERWNQDENEAWLLRQAEDHARDLEHAAHVRAERAARKLTSITELEVHTPGSTGHGGRSTLEKPEFWVIEVSNSWYWDIQIEDFILDQGLDVALWFDFYRELATWCPVENRE